jgi:L-ascorbate metabolism protein UlaG (beta-lactamase superfamily)
MDIEYKGGNCVVLTVKKNTIVVDPKLSDLKLKDQGANAGVQLLTQPQFEAPHGENTLVINGPGEYEFANMSIRGVAAQAHMDTPEDGKKATMYSITAEDISVVVAGHVHPDISEDQLEELGVVDVLIVPVGGGGYTLDATGAVELIRRIDPKIVIPTHYADDGTTYPVPQSGLEVFNKELGAALEEPTNKLKLKAGTFGEKLIVQQLNRVA